MRLFTFFIVLSIVFLLPNFQQVKGKDQTRITIEIHFDQHRFNPEKVAVPAGIPIEIRVINSGKERIEFESFALNREKVISAGQTIVVRLPALRPGRYDFFDDFHNDVPEGVIAAR